MAADARTVLADLVAALGLTTAAVGAVWAGIGGLPRRLLVLPLLVFLPGYALVSIIFPRAGTRPAGMPLFDDRATRAGDDEAAGTEPDLLGRLALGFVTSLAVVPLAVVALELVAVPLSGGSIRLAVGGATAGLLALAAVRRLAAPPGNRFAIEAGDLPTFGYAATASPRSSGRRWDARLPNGFLVVRTVCFLAAVTFALVNPSGHDGFTEFRVETDDTTGETQSLYPDRLPAGHVATVGTVVTNREGSAQRYTIVAQLRQVERAGGEVTVASATRAGTTTTQVGDGERARVPVDVETGDAGDRRLVLLLSRGNAPAEPSASGADRVLRLDVTVGEGSSNLAPPAGVLPGAG
jgi:uncharacterized membrane protein